jgi:hypothetical protein
MTHGWNDERLTDTPLAPVEFWVRSEDADRARAALKELEAQSSSSGDA